MIALLFSEVQVPSWFVQFRRHQDDIPGEPSGQGVRRDLQVNRPRLRRRHQPPLSRGQVVLRPRYTLKQTAHTMPKLNCNGCIWR